MNVWGEHRVNRSLSCGDNKSIALEFLTIFILSDRGKNVELIELHMPKIGFIDELREKHKWVNTIQRRDKLNYNIELATRKWESLTT